MKKKIYLSGPMAGHEAEEITERFKAWEKALRLSLPDATIVNPAELYPGADAESFDYEALLNIDKAILGTCDAIFVLPGWEDSNGANVELELAEEIGIPIHGWASRKHEEARFYANNEEVIVIKPEKNK